MNVHFLELFYYVARHGGISAAVRKIPYGIQQPAVSTQIGKLERDLGLKLFERTPFRLTPSGELLYAHVGPFFDGMAAVRARLRATQQTELRIGGAEMILRDHLPGALRAVKKQFPSLRFSLRTLGFQAEAETWLRKGELDVAFLALRGQPPPKMKQLAMARLSLVLRVDSKSPYKSAAELFGKRKLSLPLICLPETTNMSRIFQDELKRRRIHWPQTIEATTLDLVDRYVANGDGIGINLEVGLAKKVPGVRSLALENFPMVTMGAVWFGELTPAAKATVDSIHAHARKAWPGSIG